MGIVHPKPFRKQPGETVIWDVDFKLNLPSGVTLTGTPTANVVGDDASLTVTSLVISGTAVQATYAAGTDGKRYRVEIVVNFSNGEIREGDVYVIVRDD